MTIAINKSDGRCIISAADLERLTDDLEVLADWKADLDARIQQAQLCFQTIGLSEEKREKLIHEANCFTRICSAIAREYSR